jgi:hypothetical protein
MIRLSSCGIERGESLSMPCHRFVAQRIMTRQLTPHSNSSMSSPIDTSSSEGQQELEAARLGRTEHTNLLAKYFYIWMSRCFYLVLPNQSHLRHASTLRNHVHVWETLFPGSWAVERILHGFDISAPDGLTQDRIPREVDEEQRALLRPLKEQQLAKGICVELPGTPTPQPGVFYLRSFPVPKATPGKFRDCINGVPLNQHTEKSHFKGEGVQQLIASLQPGDWAITSDWDGFYNHATLTPRSQRLCRTTIDNRIIQYVSVTFGLHEAPIWLHMLLKPVFALLRSLGLRFGGQTDDWAWLGQSFMDCLVAAQVSLGLCCMLGLILNNKGTLIPTQRFNHVGGHFNTRIFYSFLPPRKVLSIRSAARSILRRAQKDKGIPLREIASLIGKLNAAVHYITPCRVMSRELMRLTTDMVKLKGWASATFLPLHATSLIQWWVDHIRMSNGRPTHQTGPSIHITKDASQWAWGAVLDETGERAMGFWDRSLAGAHSTQAEVMADIAAARAFILLHDLRDTVIGIRSDATVSVSYINKQGGRLPHLSHPVSQFLQECWMTRRLTFVATHIAGKDNVIADALSRTKNAWTELELHQLSFQTLEMVWGPHSVDLMAAQPNAKVTRYFSWHPDPASAGVDVFSQDIRLETNPYIFPPDPMIRRVLEQISQQQAGPLTIVTHLWPSQPWFPLLSSMLVDIPIILNHPRHSIVLPPLLLHQGAVPPPATLIGWRICGRACRQREFREWLSTSLCATGRTAMEDTLISLSTGGQPTARDLACIMRTLTGFRL